MKTNAQQINAIANLAKPFDAIQTAHFLAREIVSYNKSSDKLIDLQKQIEDTKVEKGARKKAIDNLLKELWTNNVSMVVGKGVTKCPIRLALKEVLSKEGLAEKTVNNIIGAVGYALNNKKPYDIHAVNKLAQQKKIDDAKKEGASTPTSTPTSTAPKIKSGDKTQYVKDMAVLCQTAIKATEDRRMLNDEHKQVYADIIELFNEIMDNMGSLK